MPVRERMDAKGRALAEKFQILEANVNDRVVERRREAKGAVIAILARVHHLQLGPPGVAKTYLVDTLMRLISDAKYAPFLMHGYSVMEDLYGPISLKALDDDRYVRKTDLYIPWADFILGDEVFKANPTLLQTNLWAFNERKFRNDGEILDIPLNSGFFTSNEGPEDPVLLAAFDDRIHLRYLVAPIKEPAARVTMLRARLRRQSEAPIVPVISMADITAAQEYVRKVDIPDQVLETLNELYEELVAEQIVPTDRKIGEAIPVIQATAFYNGRTVATIEDMKLLRDMLWHNPKDRPVVADKVDELANPIDKEASVLAVEIDALAAKVEDIIRIDARAVRIRRGVQLQAKMQACNDELLALRARAKSEGVTSDVVDDGRRRLHSLTRRLLVKGFRVTGDGKNLDQAALMKQIQEIKAEAEAEGLDVDPDEDEDDEDLDL